MLPDPTVPPSLMSLLEKVGTFTAPSLRTFVAVVTGLVAATGKRTATGMELAASMIRLLVVGGVAYSRRMTPDGPGTPRDRRTADH